MAVWCFLWLWVASSHQIPAFYAASPTLKNVESLRVQFRQLWSDILTHSPNKTIYLPLARGDIKKVTHGLASLNATRGEIDSIAFYKTRFNGKAVGMRVSFAFQRRISKRSVARMLAIVDLRPTGRWRLFDFCDCHATQSAAGPRDIQLQVYVNDFF